MALLNTNYLKTLVAIGVEEKNKFSCQATGFLIGFIAKNSKKPEKKEYYIYLVTNRHVFEEKRFVDLRFNTKNGSVKIFSQSLSFDNNEPRWLSHRNKKVDLALLSVNPEILQENSIEFNYIPEDIFAYYRNFQNLGIEAGDELYILGFPLGFSGNLKNFACVKWGIISRIDKEIIKEEKAFFIDSSIFPGNSGGPVIIRPEIASLDKTKSVNTSYLIGVVSAYIPFIDKHISMQTKNVVSIVEENSGLAFVVPMDYVRQIFNNWKSKKKTLEKSQKEAKQFINEIREIHENEK